MEQMHSLLKRQLKRHPGRQDAIPEEWQGFVEAVNDAYWQSDSDRNMLERSLELSSQELLQANSELRAIFQALPDLFLLLDNEGTILDHKGGMANDICFQVEKLLGKSIHEVPFEKVGDKFVKAIHQVRETNSMVSIEYSIRMQEQEYFYETRLLPLLEDQVIAIVRNITERKRTEKAVLESEEKFKAISSSAKDAIIMMDNEGNISYWNEEARKIFGYSVQEALGKELHIFLAPPKYHDACRRGIPTFKATGRGSVVGKTLELEAVKKDGTRFPIELSVSAVKIEEKWHATGILRDITLRKQAEAELRRERDRAKESMLKKISLLNERTKLIAKLEKANIQLRGLDRLKSAFLTNISHELRTPMNSIIGYSDLLLDGVDGPINEEQKKSLSRITNNARHLLQLLNDLLDLSKIEAGKAEIEAEQFNLKGLIDSVVPFFEGMITGKGLSLGFDIDENLPLVYGDKSKIKHVLINLLNNAIKFTHEGGIIIHAKISDRGIQLGESPIFAEVCIEDTGIGIKDEDLDKIFNKFVQADISIVRQYEGTGLGLSIARGLIVLHNGMIWATSEYGKGSQFHFTIPLKKETLKTRAKPVVELRMADALSEDFGVPVETSEEEISRKTVLAIDDNLDAIDIIRKSLGKDYKIVGLLSGEKAVEKAMETRPVAITLDILMPQKDGWQVLRELKSAPETRDIPVIVVSIVDNKKLGFSLGAAEYIVKPLEKDFFLKKIRDLEKTGKIQRALVVDNEMETVSLIEHILQDVGCQVKTAYNSQDAIRLIQSFVPGLIILNLTMPKVNGFDVIEYIKTEDSAKNIPLILITKRDLGQKEKDDLDGRIRGILNKGVLKEEDLLQELRDRINEIKSA